MIGKLFIFGFVLLLLVGGVYALDVRYSNPTINDGVVEWKLPTVKPETIPCSNSEWNSYFNDYKNGLVSREDTIKKLRECDRW